MRGQKTRLRAIRREREISLEAVAKATGLNISTISRAERGLLELSDANKARLAEFFNEDASALLAPVEAA